jgi:hypothetical protein
VRATSETYSESDLLRIGSHYEFEPRNGVAANGEQGWLTPTWDSGAATHELSDMAYATYKFHIPGYDRDARLILDWSASDDANTFVALANWDHNNWDWYFKFDDFTLPNNNMEPYINSSGDMLVVVAVLGTDTVKLNNIHVGSYPPDAVLNVDATYGNLPLSITLDASASTDPDGGPLTFEFDADGDGSYDSGPPSATTTFPWQYNLRGGYDATVRVTNTANAHSYATLTVYGVAEWVHSWGGSAEEYFNDVASGPDGMLYAVGETKDGKALISKWSPAGDLLWLERWAVFDQVRAKAAEIDSDGNLVVAGTRDVGGVRSFTLQKWSPNGAFIWSYQYGAADNVSVGSLQLDGNDIYLAGNSDEVGSDSDVVLMKFDTDGNIVWQRYRDSGGNDQVDSMTRIVNATGLLGMSVLYTSDYGTDWNLLRSEFGLNGSVTSERQLGSAAQPKVTGRMLRSYNLLTGTVAYYVTGLIDTGNGDEVFVSRTDGSGANVWSHVFTGLNDIDPNSICLTTDSQLLVSGSKVGTARAWSMTLNPADGTCDWSEYWTPSGGSSGYASTQRTSDLGLFYCGFMHDTNYTYSELPTQLTDLNLSWTSHSNSGEDPGLTQTLSLGSYSNVASQGVLDSGGGGDDAMVWLKPQL